MTYSTKMDWQSDGNGSWWVELRKNGERVAYLSLDEWKALGATQQAIEDDLFDRAAEEDPDGDV
jgi:hypothetical protein